ncbi:poly-gamma-glutamate synthesis protein (capsule biosynthesis protein) [Paenibacillus taihuensis]|uniref:Poly-gamma-glutamate synthesis protein (Capsule biosynthesis protein) n=1 Tax=Paenibacillus taihuensis TaxID=1156355 RepID=A0A3D9RS27_9BACL|nr:CapA family protein [Paenibacillus taihuensis]REE82710.1 poly-gamma-glutamate synthesis protein (capsule biosynthesis protein) [Paenibacillus taihuensis]
MHASRSEKSQHQKKQRRGRMRRLLAINIVMLLILGALAVVYVVQRDGGTKKLDVAAENGNATGTNNAAASGDNAAATTGDNATSDDSSNSGTNAEAGHDDQQAVSDGADGGAVTDTSSAPGDSITLSFAGDVLLAAAVENLMQKNGFDYPYTYVQPFLQKPDFMAVNLETPVTTRGTPAQNKQYVYKSSPDALPALKASGIDLVNLANNHTMDQGEEGLLDTIEHLDSAGIPNMGAGRDDAEAFKPVLLEAKGISVAYIGLSRVIPEGSWKAGKDHPGLAETYDSTRAVKAIQEAKKQADLVVVMVHWGIEREDNPNADQTRLAHEYIDAGADLVIGSHPHTLQGFESYKGKWIAYSLGNFIFPGMTPDKTKDTGVVDARCSVDGKCSLLMHPMRSNQSQPAPLKGEDAAALLKRISSISIHASIDAAGNVKPKE